MHSMARKHVLVRLTVILFWVTVWSVFAAYLPDVLFAGPIDTLRCLLRQIQMTTFWISILHSLCKITIGFVLAFLFGAMLAIAGYYIRPIGILLEPAIQIMKTVPIACFIVVALIWLSSAHISVLVAFFVVFPAVYINLMLEIIGLRRIRDFSHGSFRNRHNRVNRLQEDHRLVRSWVVSLLRMSIWTVIWWIASKDAK